ncbi:hypothetical protein GGX14DRAFT_401371 [Mycena pura]|uniref:Uncharacterized protein n=1 Tax=Mycena pura TaxID=153505 RepID=A0AAD6V0T9_9AGAR|nr:hypothetical protein GGX14DRAFT_401371 [Mycena pura]
MPSLPTPADVPWTSIHTSTAASTVVANILASGALDEISNYSSEDGEESAIKSYLRSPSAGRAREGKLTRGIIFWVYPTGRHGPTETLEGGDSRRAAGTVLMHGLLVTVESGADLEQAERRIFEAVPENGIAHLHIRESRA